MNEQGNVTDRYTYDAWGNVTAHDQYTGSIGNSQPYRYVGKLGYYTHHQDPNMDLLQLGVRFYDPETGRFTQEDPAKDGVNPYAYVGDHVLRAVDPTGMYQQCWGFSTGFGAAIGAGGKIGWGQIWCRDECGGWTTWQFAYACSCWGLDVSISTDVVGCLRCSLPALNETYSDWTIDFVIGGFSWGGGCQSGGFPPGIGIGIMRCNCTASFMRM